MLIVWVAITDKLSASLKGSLLMIRICLLLSGAPAPASSGGIFWGFRFLKIIQVASFGAEVLAVTVITPYFLYRLVAAVTIAEPFLLVFLFFCHTIPSLLLKPSVRSDVILRPAILFALNRCGSPKFCLRNKITHAGIFVNMLYKITCWCYTVILCTASITVLRKNPST